MKIPNPRIAVTLQIGFAAILFAGCRPSRQPESASDPVSRAAPEIVDDIPGAAEAALGKQAEVLAQGNLARNGLEQLLVINRFAGPASGTVGMENTGAILVRRAAVLEKHGIQWTEVLLCDEYLKNPSGYLGGAPAARVNGWRLEFVPDTGEGLEMKFTPVNFEAGDQETGAGEPAGKTIVVRWNTRAKRYQSLDTSQERYLGEAPTLETPHSILR